jgi:CubicO group peptidase (beta-lactamase class C family)
MDISGTCAARFVAVRDAFVGNFGAGSEPVDVGASVAVTIDGELVVDLWAGVVNGDDGSERPWQ